MTPATSRTELQPGENSIDRVKAKTVIVKGTKYKRITWTLKYPDGTAVQKMTTSRDGTLTDLRTKAKRKAKKLLSEYKASHADPEEQAHTMTFGEFIEGRTRGLIDKADLRPSTRYEYMQALAYIKEELGARTIEDGAKYLPLEQCLIAIVEKHGATQAKKARTVLSRYVLDEMMKLELIPANRIQGRQLNVEKPKRKRGGHALTLEQHRAVMARLLDNSDLRGFRASSVRKKENVRLLTLIQAATGMRQGEVLALKVSDVRDEDEQMTLHVSAEISKTHQERNPVVLDARVREAIRERIAGLATTDYVVGSPTDDSKRWDKSNCGRAVVTLYKQLAGELDIPLLQTERSHVWRTTLNMLLIDAPVAVRAAQFGHTETINQSAYTAKADPAALLTEYERFT